MHTTTFNSLDYLLQVLLDYTQYRATCLSLNGVTILALAYTLVYIYFTRKLHHWSYLEDVPKAVSSTCDIPPIKVKGFLRVNTR